MDQSTHFASPERAEAEVLARDIEFASKNPVINSLLETVGGIVAVLNQQRQVLVVNEAFLKDLEVDDVQSALGLKLGEAIGCTRVEQAPSGCGTGKACITCGAAIATVACLSSKGPIERNCAVSVDKDGETRDIYLSVRAQRIVFQETPLILILARDISAEHQRAALERAFNHDVRNILTGLIGAADLLGLVGERESKKLVATVGAQAKLLNQEIKFQQFLAGSDDGHDQSVLGPVSWADVLGDLRKIFDQHPMADGKNLNFAEVSTERTLQSNRSLLARVLTNMLVNGLEASAAGEEVKIWAEEQAGAALDLCVGNAQFMPPEVALRIFQRNFSTKADTGRGLGTYSMKLLAENFLDAKVSFETSETEGTIFRIRLPLA